MNKTFFDYKKRFLTLSIILAYAAIHIKLTASFVEVTPEKLINFASPLPYSQRILVPAISHLLKFLFPLSILQIFFLLEIIFVTLLFLSLQKLLNVEFDRKQSKILSLIFFLLLPLIMVINYRLPVHQCATFFYPYDTAQLLFLTLGFLFCLNKNWILFYLTIAVATFNRETSILIVLLIPTLHWQNFQQQNKSEIIKPFLLSLVIYICIHYFILYFLIDPAAAGKSIEIYFRETSFTHFQMNLTRLSENEHWLYFLFSMGFAPVFWFTFYDYIPKYLQPIRYLALFDFLLLLVFGNFMEGRIFAELFLLLYFPVCIGIRNWLNCLNVKEVVRHQEVVKPQKDKNIIFYINRYAVLGILIIVFFMAPLINRLIVFLSVFYD